MFSVHKSQSCLQHPCGLAKQSDSTLAPVPSAPQPTGHTNPSNPTLGFCICRSCTRKPHWAL